MSLSGRSFQLSRSKENGYVSISSLEISAEFENEEAIDISEKDKGTKKKEALKEKYMKDKFDLIRRFLHRCWVEIDLNGDGEYCPEIEDYLDRLENELLAHNGIGVML